MHLMSLRLPDKRSETVAQPRPTILDPQLCTRQARHVTSGRDEPPGSRSQMRSAARRAIEHGLS
jgi:hypothetical protein